METVSSPPEKKGKSQVFSGSDPQGADTGVPVLGDLDIRSKDLFNLVFAIDLLREKIVDLVIHEGKQLSLKNASTCRLVSHDWLQYVNKVLTKAGEPLLHLNVSKETVFHAATAFQHAYSCNVLEFAPPFAMKIPFGEINSERGIQILEQCLRWCSSGLLNLELGFNLENVQLISPSNPDPISLPVLQKLVLRFPERDWVDPLPNRMFTDIQLLGGNIIYGIQTLLSGCEMLTHFNLQGTSNTAGWLPGAFKTLRLPDTVTHLELHRGIIMGDLEPLIMNNALPNLTTLTLTIPDTPDDGSDLFYKIFDRVRHTLKTLNIEGGKGASREEEKMPVHFPVMEVLETLIICGTNWKWENRVVRFDRSFAAVKKIGIRSLSPNMLHRFVQNSRFETTEQLVLHVPKAASVEENEGLGLALSQVPEAFPKLTVLDITTFARDDTPHSFHTIFRNMKHLEKLYICFHDDTDSTIVDPPQFWKMMFLGVSTEEITTENPAYITYLSGLRQLNVSLTQQGIGRNNIPDDVFEYGFLKMHKLTNLTLTMNIKASNKMADKWRQAGRKLIHKISDS